MHTDSNVVRIAALASAMWLLMSVVSPEKAVAQMQWRATVGAATRDNGTQALAFLPNEIWIHQGDSIKWKFAVDEIHTVTFLMDGQVRPLFQDGCPGISSDPAVFDGSTCVTTPPLVTGDSFTVFFPSPGNFKLVCLVHENMTGVVHVLATGERLPHDQRFYDDQADDQARDLLAIAKALDDGSGKDKDGDDDGHGSHGHHDHKLDAPSVIAGIGAITATPGGSDTTSVLRFIDSDIVVRKGTTVEFTNHDPVTPHTITFGVEPPDPTQKSPNVTTDADGALHVTLNSPSDSAHSGFIMAAYQDQLFLQQTPLGFTRFRVTFTKAGTYPYICALHDDLGMKGKIIVVP